MSNDYELGERVWIYDAYLRKIFSHGVIVTIENLGVRGPLYLVEMDDPKLPNLARVSGTDLVFMQSENAPKEVFLRNVAPAHPRAPIKPIATGPYRR
jgi:hypothetical protein